MKNLGTQISDDGATNWRNNCGIIERNFAYADDDWETVAECAETPHTPDELKEMCKKGGYEYISPKQKGSTRFLSTGSNTQD